MLAGRKEIHRLKSAPLLRHLASYPECQSPGSEPDIESAGRGIAGAGVEQLRGYADGAAEQIRVRSVQPGEPRERRERARSSGIGKGDLILLREAGLVLALRAREGVNKFSVAGGIASARGAVGGVLREGIEGGRERRLRRVGDGRLLRLRVAGIGEQVLIACRRLRTERLARSVELLVHGVLLGELLVNVLSPERPAKARK